MKSCLSHYISTLCIFIGPIFWGPIANCILRSFYSRFFCNNAHCMYIMFTFIMCHFSSTDQTILAALFVHFTCVLQVPLLRIHVTMSYFTHRPNFVYCQTFYLFHILGAGCKQYDYCKFLQLFLCKDCIMSFFIHRPNFCSCMGSSACWGMILTIKEA